MYIVYTYIIYTYIIYIYYVILILYIYVCATEVCYSTLQTGSICYNMFIPFWSGPLIGFEDTGAAQCARDLLRPLCLKGIQGYPSHGKTKLLEDWTGDDIGLPEESG